ncbi:MFS transporter [Pseudothauera rhizosphaerae]|uniref:MFS transporter n=1 Tax=Pseudothauera rhizosphaerae TaxID=2565932 RepID=A0A4S4AE01_9RHOO|nr:MFS transporter [Pseudothauera rhizosphaerae]THF57247.1 MFS transporter [Pseudothauera rhizosphaerae]
MTAVPSVLPAAPAPRSRGLLRLFLAFFAVLTVVLVLNGGLTLGAMRKVQFESTSAAVRVVGHDWAQRIQGAIRFGKPIAQFYGLNETLAEIARDLPAVSTVALTDAAGHVIGSHGDALRTGDLAAAVKRTLAAPGMLAHEVGGRHYLSFPIKGRDDAVAGALVMVVDGATITGALEPHVESNLALLAMVALGGSVLLLGGLLLINPMRGEAGMSGWRLYALPIAVMVLAQGVYSWESIATFRTQYVDAVQDTARIALSRLERDLERLFAKGVQIERLVGIEAPFGRIMGEAAEIGFIEVRAADGRVLARVHRDGSVERDAVPLPEGDRLDTVAGLDVPAAGGPLRVGSLRLHLEEGAIAAGARQRLLDSGTLVLISALFVVELFVLLAVLLRQQRARGQQAVEGAAPVDYGRHVLGRPSAFLLLFAWALPLSFIPLRMRELYVPIAGLSEHVVLALPLSAEMLCALVTALFAGALTDRRGWHLPFLAGVVVTVVGALLSTLANGPWSFVGARAVVGAGYGLAWMGIQGFIFLWATPQTRARGLAHLVAGIFAGHICGSAVGAMLAQQLGYVAVFGLGAALSVLPAVFVLSFMWPYFGKPAELPGVAAEPSRNLDLASVWRLLRDRNFTWLQLGSVVPFSVAQVGLLYFTLPLFLADQGVSQSTIGRIMMIYGLSVIYLGPMLGRFVDDTHNKKTFIVLGGLIGSLGMIYLFFDKSLFAITLSVFALGLGSAFAGAAQSAFALNLDAVKEMGMGKAMGVQRAADKLGQMIGPLLIGALFASVGAASGLAITGTLYLAATLLFLLIARTPGTAEELQPAEAAAR